MPPSDAETSKWENATAGAVAGFATVAALHPLDVVRTRFQVSGGRVSNLPSYKNTGHAIYTIARMEGFKGLYSGFYPAVFGSSISWGLYFFFYSRAKHRYLKENDVRNLIEITMVMKITSDSKVFQQWHEAGGRDRVPGDVRIVTSGGHSLMAHSSILASASPVLESKLDRQWNHRRSERVIQILGVPCDAVVAFVGFLYSSKSTLTPGDRKEAMEKNGLHLLVLSHAYRVAWLKRVCEDGLASQLTVARVVDVLQLALKCDAPRLYQKCMRLIAKDFDSVQQTESWRFVQRHDLRLELEILKFLQEADQRKNRRRRERIEQEKYEQLNEVMECLNHICTEGCTEVGPLIAESPNRCKTSCTHFRTCLGLQHLIRHFATCQRKLHCPHCKRMSQLFRLHSSICDLPSESCKVPLCKQFKSRKEEGKEDDEIWRLLVKKVIIARVMSTLARQKRTEHLHKMWARYRRSR